MNSETLAYFCFVIMILTHACSTHAEDVYRCPPEVSVSWSIPAPPTGWDVSGAQEGPRVAHYLVSVTFSDGPPENGAFLRPALTREVEVDGGSVVIERYEFSDRVNPTIWLVCRYGNTPATLTKSIPAEMESCEVKRPKDLSEQEVRCR
ncbi:hypothetical protein sS8_4286 [Methylocaldum marinum]|jgi:hypothetical protein|uniref:Uncharacterized protein n=1 Tax=Methylocaldum marinum TaxID=1432792 RepID=A0A250KXH2_9GAMM|nr:hypothetical protein sS8_4286 [Methylocaldum marinum]